MVKIYLHAALIALIFITCSWAQQGQLPDVNNAALKEADALSVEVVKLFNASKFTEALPLAQKVLDIRRLELGKTHVSVAAALRNLGYVYAALEKEEKAEEAFEDAFDVYEKNQPLPKSHLSQYAEMLQNVAVKRYKRGFLEKAEKNLSKALGIIEGLNGKDSIEASHALLKLSQFYQAEQDDEKAAPLLVRAVEINLAKLGHKDQRTEFSFLNLTCAMTKLGRLNEIDDLERRMYPPAVEKEDDNSNLEFNPIKWVRTIKGGVVNGKALNLEKPPYPAEAKQKRITGTVNVQVLINEKGKVIHACAIKGARELQRGSEVASYRSSFTPTTLDSKPVKVRGVIVYNYTVRP